MTNGVPTSGNWRTDEFFYLKKDGNSVLSDSKQWYLWRINEMHLEIITNLLQVNLEKSLVMWKNLLHNLLYIHIYEYFARFLSLTAGQNRVKSLPLS